MYKIDHRFVLGNILNVSSSSGSDSFSALLDHTVFDVAGIQTRGSSIASAFEVVTWNPRLCSHPSFKIGLSIEPIKMFFLNGPFPTSFSLFSSFQYS